MQNLPNTTEDRIMKHVMADLSPPWLAVQTKIAVATVLGALLSLLVCGQFGFGLTSFADAFNHKIHQSMGPVMCAVVCGGLYAVFPMMILRFVLCPPLQFRGIMQRRWASVMTWFLGFGSVFALLGHHGGSILLVAAWIFGALVVANIMSKMIFRLAPKWDLNWELRTLRGN